MPNSIRINTGAVKIEVNDDGDYITLPFGDQTFPTRFFSMMEDFEARQEDYKKRAEEIDSSADSDTAKAKAGTQLNLEIHQYFRSEVDRIFGPDTCRKVFGDIVPGIELYAEFFDLLKPYFEKYGKERAAKMKKYSAGRRGNV